MKRYAKVQLRHAGRWIGALLTTLAVSLSISSALAAAPVSQAGATAFCNNVTLQAWGKAGDTCYAGLDQGGTLFNVQLYTFERAGCLTYAGYYGELYHTWQCVGNNSSTEIVVPDNGGWYRGVIRNNNTQWAARFGGSYACCRH
jgi:hypothetical protein